ncbi:MULTISPECIES: hypothetical protein [unclassified Mesorhizobium]|uniref:hypothetical protein n=1 Tax=unclassified Mesorhizobium TaxID=325217 RepID=UPI00109206D6|nr:MULTISPECIES: hypothetical protein [unclassified Mesorhizobium]TGS43746.1 hypothetical protein EN825_17040 [Mesorhizobium sp. M8A.F.Ca.ET.182.01.1.1]TGS78327.1 hypothetical protein EN824_26505 [Mesorhizobium sp. M8A.F.Ca.ET.181.01.1.1]TGV15465.1 hypothetical protein EN816_08700 [Mesorhizobium sp. M8A.F.Ca.ET.173.01.1.1]
MEGKALADRRYKGRTDRAVESDETGATSRAVAKAAIEMALLRYGFAPAHAIGLKPDRVLMKVV